jgi:hypothetical protein
MPVMLLHRTHLVGELKQLTRTPFLTALRAERRRLRLRR